MVQHFEDRHNHNPNKLPCPFCNRSFNTKESLEEHLRSPVHQLNEISASDAAAAAAADNIDLVTPAMIQLEDRQVACNDCGKLMKSTDSLHQHQWDSAIHTRVSKSPVPNPGSCVRACSQCSEKFGCADHLEEHFMDTHPISELPESSEERTWQIVAERFISEWKKPTIKMDKVHRIFKVYNTGRRRKEFEEYRRELKKEMANDQTYDEIRKRVLLHGNEQTRYHGTTVKCRLGRPPGGGAEGEADAGGAAALCTSTDCSLCRILQVGFKKSMCKKDRFQRFGIGIYTSSVSSKSHDYVKCTSSDVKDNYKVMIVCKVLVGRPHHYTRNARELEGPPRGYHSVQGDPGEVLNYEELVVYDDRAILPAFIILYSTSEVSSCSIT